MSAGSWLGWEDIHWMLVVSSHGLAPELCESRKLAEHKHGCISFPLSWLWMWCTLHWAPTLTSLLSWTVMWNCKPTKPFLPSLVFFFVKIFYRSHGNETRTISIQANKSWECSTHFQGRLPLMDDILFLHEQSETFQLKTSIHGSRDMCLQRPCFKLFPVPLSFPFSLPHLSSSIFLYLAFPLQMVREFEESTHLHNSSFHTKEDFFPPLFARRGILVISGPLHFEVGMCTETFYMK